MHLLENYILREGKVVDENLLKVDSFLNHQIDIDLFQEIGKEFYKLFSEKKITKILTIEASGIGIACITAQYFRVPVLFAKKQKVKTQNQGSYTTNVVSFTHERKYDIRVSKEYLHSDDKVLIIDDFLANGQAILGLMELAKQAGAEVIGAGAVIEKGFQCGGDMLREKGIHLESLAIVEKMDTNGNIEFRKVSQKHGI